MPEIIAGFRPSSVQKRLWSLQEGAADYASRCLVRLAGPLDAAALRKALGLVTGRHDVLRTGFRRRPGIRFPIQVVAETAAGFFWRTEDLRTLTATKREEQIAELFRAEVDFDLETGPVIDAVLIAVGEDEHLLRLVLPALCADLGALQILVRELVLAYGGRTDELEEEPLQHVQFSEWQNNLLEEEDSALALERWRKRWMALPPDATLPFEMRVAEPVGFRPEEVIVRLGAVASAAAAELVAERGATRAAFLLSCWQVLLCRLTGRSQLAVWRTFEGRKYDVLAGMVGTASKCLPLRAGFEADYRFGEVLAETQAASEAAWEDLEYFAWPQEDVSSAAIFYCAGFEWLELPAASQARGVSFEIRHQRADIDRFRIALLAVGDGADCKLALRYDPAFLRRSDVERWAGHLLTLVEGALASPDMPVSDLPLLSEEERVELLSEWGVGVGAIPPTGCVHHLVESWAEREPGRPALVCGTARLSYGELVDRSHRLAYRLRRLGVGPESRVALFLPRSLDSVVGLLAVLAAGGAYVPLEPGTPAERVAFLLADSGSQVVVTHRSLLGLLPAWVETICLDGDPDPLAGEDLGVLSAEAGPENLAYVIFTSGSTGQPKGVAVEHRQLWHYVHAVRSGLELPEGGSYAMVSTFAADLGHTSLYPSLCFGGCLHVIAEQQASDPFALAEYFERNPVDCLKIVPSHLAAVEQYAPAGRLLPRQRLILGGEISRPEWVERLVRTAPPTCTICNHYGPTETTVGVLAYRLMNGSAPRESASLPIGRPLGANRAYVLGGGMRPVPVGVAGELYLGGAGVSRGYLGRPVQTAERFVPDPFGGPGLRLYRTGDQARWLPTGDVEFLGRADHQVKIRGFRVELGEIESALARHPAVREAVVVARREGEGAVRLAAYLTQASTSRPSVEELRGFLLGVLPDYMVPSFFITLDVLPLTANGKVDRRALPAPGSVRPNLQDAYAAPRTPTEVILATIWAEVLGLERVGVNDNFFALGGDSLHSVQVLAMAKERKMELTLQHLFQHQTVATLAASMEGREGTDQDSPARRLSASFDLVSAEDRRQLPAGIEDAYPVTGVQYGMLYHQELTPDSPAYHNVYSFHLRAPFDAELLQRAVQRSVDRYPMLRTGFHLTGFSEPLQLVHRSAELSVVVADLRQLPYEEQQKFLEEFVRAERLQLFDLFRPPLWRMHIHRRTNATFQFTLIECHAISDGWTTNSTLAEIFAAYSSLLKQEEPPPEPYSGPFRDYVALEREAASSEEARRFWMEKLADPPSFRLPRWSRIEPGTGPSNIRRVNLPIAAEVQDGLERLARSAAVPLKSVALAAHLKVMSLLSGNDDVLTGLLMDGRPEDVGGNQVRGLCLNAVPLRFTLAGSSWFELVRRVFAAERELSPYRRFPLAELNARRGGEPLIEVLFDYLHFRSLESVVSSSDIEVLHYGNITVSENNFTLTSTFWVDPVPSQVALIFRYDVYALSDEQARSIFGYHARILESMAADPLHDPFTSDFLSEEERRELLSEWGVGVGAIPPTGCVHHLVESWAEREPGRPALVCGTARLSYGELVDRSHRLAYRLRRLGVGPESRVALFLPRSLDSVVGLLAVLVAGGAYVPLEPGTPAERVAFLLADSGSQVVVTHRSLLGSLPAWVETICLDGDPDPLAGEDLGVLSAEAGPENLAYVIFTSGSTGQPKGVAVEHRQLWHYVHAVRSGLELPEGGSYAMVSTFAADLGHTSLYPSLCFGGCLHVIAEQQASDPFALAEYFERNPVDCLKIVPSHLAAVEQYAPAGRLLPRQRLILGGEISRPEWVERLERTAPPTCTICNHYGPTETTVGVLAYRLMNGSAPRESASLPIGRPLGANRAYVLGGGMRPVPVGVPGELYLGGAGVSRGYLGRPVQTAERFVPDPFGGPGLRLYRTGDLARWLPTGDVEFLGRADHQVKIRGFRVELGEIESALTRHPAVREAVVVAREDQPGERRLVAYIVPAESPPSPLELRAFLRSELPEYMLPAAWMMIPEVPLTANGKVDRQALPIPDVDAAEILEQVAPRTPTEELLAGLWSRILRIDRVGAHDDFFELGGHSLLAAQLVFRVREAFGIHLRVAALFEQPTLAGLAAVVDSTRRASQGLETPPIARVPRGGPLPQSYAQQRLWFMEQLDDKSLAYNIPQAIQLRGRVDVPALERSFTELARRHETLRTTLDVKDGEPVQFIHPARPVVLPAVDLTALSAALREATIQKLTLAEAQAKFDLARGPLFRVRLLRQQEGEDLLLFTQHHVIGDGWSMRILTHEIASLYEAFRLGRPSPLPELVLQYADYSVWQRNLLEGEVLKAHLDYWKRQLDGAPPLVTLPTDRPRPVRQKFRGANYYTSLPAAAADEIDRASRAEGVTLFMTLLAAFQVLLHQYSGQDDIVVGADIAGRDRIETEPMIGFFVNEVVLRTRMNGAETFDEVLSRARETCLGAYLHQDLPFLRLVEELRPERDLSYMPLFQVSLILRYAPAADVALEGIDLADFNIDHGWARMDLSLNVVRHREGLYLWALYDADLFDRETISRVLEVYKALLLTIAARPGIRMEELRVFLAERDREQQDNEVRSVAEAHRQKLGRIRPRVSRFLNIEPEAMEAVAVTLEGAS